MSANYESSDDYTQFDQIIGSSYDEISESALRTSVVETMYEQSTQDIYSELASMAVRPNQAKQQDISLAFNVGLLNFKKLVDCAISGEEHDVDRCTEIIATLWAKDYNERAEALVEITQSDVFNREITGEELAERYHFTDEAIANGVNKEMLVNLAEYGYVASVNADMETFMPFVIEKYECSPAAKRRAMMAKIGQHALDVAKIGAGTTIAILLTRRKQ